MYFFMDFVEFILEMPGTKALTGELQLYWSNTTLWQNLQTLFGGAFIRLVVSNTLLYVFPNQKAMSKMADDILPSITEMWELS